MHTLWHFTIPDESPTKLVEVATLSKYDVTGKQCKTGKLTLADGDRFDLVKDKTAVLNIGDTEVWHGDRIISFDSSSLGNSRLHFATVPERHHIPRGRDLAEP